MRCWPSGKRHEAQPASRPNLRFLGLDVGVGGSAASVRLAGARVWVRSWTAHSHVFLRFVVIEPAADKALGGGQCVGRVGNGLALGRLPDEPIALVCERHYRRRRPCAFGVFNDLRRQPTSRAPSQSRHAAAGKHSLRRRRRQEEEEEAGRASEKREPARPLTRGVAPSMTETHEFVVPRSMPMT